MRLFFLKRKQAHIPGSGRTSSNLCEISFQRQKLSPKMGADVDGLDPSLMFVQHLETGVIFFVLNKFLWFIGHFSGKTEERNIERRVSGCGESGRKGTHRERGGEKEIAVG